MYIDLFSKTGKYRGLSRSFGRIAAKGICSKEWSRYFSVYERYLEWQAKMDNAYCDSALRLLIELRDASQELGLDCEIILYADNPEEFRQRGSFLGFDPYWMEEGVSGLEEDSEIQKRYCDRLNENGLFCNYEDAQAFCEMWNKKMNATDLNSLGKAAKPRPFCVWVYTG